MPSGVCVTGATTIIQHLNRRMLFAPFDTAIITQAQTACEHPRLTSRLLSTICSEKDLGVK